MNTYDVFLNRGMLQILLINVSCEKIDFPIQVCGSKHLNFMTYFLKHFEKKNVNLMFWNQLFITLPESSVQILLK